MIMQGRGISASQAMIDRDEDNFKLKNLSYKNNPKDSSIFDEEEVEVLPNSYSPE